MKKLPVAAEENLLVSNDTGDDAGVYRLNDEQALVLTTDFITPLVDDPYLYGRVAAANSLSDVYAMGGTPILALNVCCFPTDAPQEALQALLQGGLDVMGEAGALLVGGHTVKDNELKYGLAAVGTVHPEKVVRNSTPRAGDKLLLTRPLGTGLMVSACNKELLPIEAMQRLCRRIGTLNNAAVAVSQTYRVSAMTDVTGFGLGGHLRGMVRGATIGARVFGDLLPSWAEVPALLASGLSSGAAKANRKVIDPLLSYEGLGETPADWLGLISDPQTAGGMLMAVHPEDTQAALELLWAQGDTEAVVIGEFFDNGGDAAIVLSHS